MPVGSATMSAVDYDGQVGSLSINTAVITAANFAAINTALGTLQTELENVIDGLWISRTITQTTLLSGGGTKSDQEDSQRGNKWDIQAYDSSTELAAGVPNPYYLKPFNYLVPTADLDLRVQNSNVVWVQGGGANVAAFDDVVTAFEAVAKSPVGGNLNVHTIEAVTAGGG